MNTERILGSKEMIRDINSKLVLETIMSTSSTSRAAVSKKLGLTKATISAIVQELIQNKLVLEVGSDNTTLGRKPILLSFHKQAGYAICVDIGTHMLSALSADLQGESRTLKKVKTPPKEKLLQTLIDFIYTFHQDELKYPYGLVGITLGIHGVVTKNQVQFAPYYDFPEIDLAEQLSQQFHVPVFLENEANLSVLAEQAYLSKSYQNIANLSIHSGVGLGLILNKQLFTGFSGYAGEFGHTIIEAEGKPCPCGNLGCLEQYLSEQILLKEFAMQVKKPAASLQDFIDSYMQNQQAAITIVDHFVYYMSIALNNLFNIINPDIVIVTSSLTNAFPELAGRISNSLHSRMNVKVPIVPSLFQDHSILLGGICVSVKNFLGISQLTFLLKDPKQDK